MIALTQVSRQFDGVRALDSVTFEAATGEILGIAGPTGAGKTTLLDVISGALRPSGGSIAVDGVALGGLPAYRVAAHGVVRAHNPARVFWAMTVMDNVKAGLYRRPGRRAARIEAAMELLDAFGLFERRGQLVAALDESARRVLEIARAVAAAPRVLLLDEPFAALDGNAAAVVTSGLRKTVAQTRATVLIAERDVCAFAELCDRAIVLHAGKLIAMGKPVDVVRDDDVRDAYLGVEWRQ